MSWNLRLTAAREAAGFSKTGLATAANVSKPTVTDWENGEIKALSAENLLGLCDLLNVAPHWLLRGEGFGPNQMPDAAELGARARVARTARLLTQEQLGELMCEPSEIVSQWELGTTPPSRTIVDLLARHLGVTSSWLLGWGAADPDAANRRRAQLSGMSLASKITAALAENRLTQEQIHLMGDLLDQLIRSPSPRPTEANNAAT